MPSALVTGGSSGIGLAIARMLREEGFDLTLASRTQEKIEAAAAELGAHAIAADMGKEEDCIRVVAEHRERFGGLDVLVNSAGIGIGGHGRVAAGEAHRPAARHQPARPAARLARGDPAAQARREGWIVNLASIAGTAPTPGLTVYGATKAAVIALTRSQNAELDADGVRAIAICPGFVDTPMAQWSGPRGRGDDPAGGLRRDRAHVPAPLAARADPAGRRRARRLERRRRLTPHALVERLMRRALDGAAHVAERADCCGGTPIERTHDPPRLLLFAAMCVIWGIPYLLIRVAVRELEPVTLGFSRTVIAALAAAADRGLAR